MRRHCPVVVMLRRARTRLPALPARKTSWKRNSAELKVSGIRQEMSNSAWFDGTDGYYDCDFWSMTALVYTLL